MLKINEDKAREIAKNKVRKWRETEFKKNDIDLQNAIADDDLATKETAIKYRNYLRDLPEQLENLSVEDMKKRLKELKIL